MATTGKTHSIIIITALLVGAVAYAQAPAPAPKKGFIPGEATAIRIVEAALPSLCGNGCAARNRPFEAKLENDIWTVYGNPPRPAGQRGGGMIQVRIDQQTGAVLSYVFA